MTKYEVGDRVEITIVGDVIGVMPYLGQFFLTLDNDVDLYTGTDGIRFRRLPPRKPEVGEVIDGARLKATPWRRGTVVRGTIAADHDTFGDDDEDTSWTYMLEADGEWHEDSGEIVPFRDLATFDELKVVHLP